MNAPHTAGQASAPDFVPALQALPAYDEDEIGCECANPQLQIDVWGAEAAAQPLQNLY